MFENSFNPIDCAYVERNLIQYHEQALSASSLKTVRAHIETCDSCAQSLAEYRQLEGMLFADSVHYKRTLFSPEAQKRVQRNVYRRVRWRMLWNRPSSSPLGYSLAAVLILCIGILGYRNIQLSNQYEVLEAQHTALVANHEILYTDHTQLSQNVRHVKAKVVEAAADKFTRDQGNIPILQEDLDKLLLVAVTNSNVSDARDILHSGADVETVDSGGRTPLFHAIDRRNRRMVDLLLDRGANINAKTVGEGTPLYQAYQIAIQYGDSSFFEWLLEEGADLNTPTIGETTMWSILSSNGDSELVEIVLEKGVDLDRAVLYDRTSLMLAAANGHKEVVSTLLSAGANKGLLTEDGRTAAQLAWDAGHWETAIILHNAGHSPELEFDHPGMQQLAMVFSHPDVIRAQQQ